MFFICAFVCSNKDLGFSVKELFSLDISCLDAKFFLAQLFHFLALYLTLYCLEES